MSACSRRIQFVAAVLKQWLVGRGVTGLSESAVQYTTALLLCRTATTGKRGGRQGAVDDMGGVVLHERGMGVGRAGGLGSGEVWTCQLGETARLKAAA